MTHTDIKLLQILLSLPSGKLSSSERRAFHAMYDDLVNGKYIGLSRKQRAWAEQVYLKYELHKTPIRIKKIETKDKNMGPFGLSPIKMTDK